MFNSFFINLYFINKLNYFSIISIVLFLACLIDLKSFVKNLIVLTILGLNSRNYVIIYLV